MDERPFQELAKRLSCAWVSYQLGITYDHCMKTYIKDEELGDYWHQLAERVAREATAHIAAKLE